MSLMTYTINNVKFTRDRVTFDLPKNVKNDIKLIHDLKEGGNDVDYSEFFADHKDYIISWVNEFAELENVSILAVDVYEMCFAYKVSEHDVKDLIINKSWNRLSEVVTGAFIKAVIHNNIYYK